MAQQKSGPPYPVILVVGIAAMLGGMWVSQQYFGEEPKIELFANLAKQGLPLDLGKTLAVIGVFLIMFPLVKMFYIQPLGDAIQERNSALEQTFADAEDLRSEMTKMKSDYEQRLVATEANAREQIQAQIKEAQTLRQSLMAEATQKADELLGRATEEIRMEKERALTDLRIHVTDLTLAATEKLLGENVDNDRNRRLVDEFINKVEVTA
jgi:F-type H+-transporting ATPase subunit b